MVVITRKNTYYMRDDDKRNIHGQSRGKMPVRNNFDTLRADAEIRLTSNFDIGLNLRDFL